MQLLKTDAGFPKRLYPFLYEELAYGYYQLGIYDSATNYLIKGLDNAKDIKTKARWTYLIAQLYEKEQKINLAYNWYRKAGSIASDPIIAVYASIYMASIEANRGEKSWESLANALERMIKRDKYQPFADIIYYEMAQLALRNKANDKANQWLIASIQKNEQNTKLKQKALVQLAAMNYTSDNFTRAKIAYNQLTGLLKSYPNYEQINLRKNWIDKIATYDELITKEATLQSIYYLPKIEQAVVAKKWQKSISLLEEQNKQLFVDPTKITTTTNANNSLINTASTFNNSNSFASTQNTNLGNNSFIKKWGDRPNVDN